jgi:hypothetical protein
LIPALCGAVECGPGAIPLLVSACPRVDPLEQSDIAAALAQLAWQPIEPDTMAAKT